MAAVPSIGRAASVEQRAVRGADATSELYERYAGQIFGYCFHQLGSREEAEDAVQTTFMNAFRGLQRGIVPRVESAWLFKIAHNVCLSRRRSTWRRGRVEAPNNLEVLQEVMPARERIGDELIRLQDVLEEMPENQRRAILLREWQGLTYREIADELGLSQSAVETLIFRARRALAAGLEEAFRTQRGGAKRARRAGDVGAVIIALKALLTGGGAKIAATALMVAATTIAGTIGSHRHANPARHAGQAPARPAHATAAASGSRRLAVASTPKADHEAPAAQKRRALPSEPTAGRTLAPVDSTALRPAFPAPAPAASKPAEAEPPASAYAAPAPEGAEPGKSDDAPGKAHENEASPPPAANPVPATDDEDASPPQQDKPDHGKHD